MVSMRMNVPQTQSRRQPGNSIGVTAKRAERNILTQSLQDAKVGTFEALTVRDLVQNSKTLSFLRLSIFA